MIGLYDQGYIIHFNEGDEALYRDFIGYTPSINDRFHTIAEDETLLSIARRYYGYSSFWFIIADANNIEDVFDLTVGDTICIPNKTLV